MAFRHVGLKDRRFGMDLELAVYRIIQEALTNVARHANVAEAMVYVGVDQGFILVQIEDKGVGFKVSDVMDAADSYGLIGMRERANMVGGTLTVDSIPGEGTLIEGRFLIIAGVYRKGFKLP